MDGKLLKGEDEEGHACCLSVCELKNSRIARLLCASAMCLCSRQASAARCNWRTGWQ